MSDRTIVHCECGEAFFWAVTKAGKPMPVNAEPTPRGILELVDQGPRAPMARVLGEPSLLDPKERWTSHFATCSRAEEFRRRTGVGKGRREHADIDVKARERPCAECPWRTDVPTGRFPVERYQSLAETAYDAAQKVFTCHKSSETNPVVCAGFLVQGAVHNLSVRLWLAWGRIDLGGVTDGGCDLYPDYVAMAVANGVDPDDPVLRPCR